MSEIIKLTETSRLRVVQDEGANCPRGDWHMLTGFVKIRNLGDSRLSDVPAVHDDPTGRIAEAMDHLERGDDRSSGDVAERVTRWARIFHGLHLEWDDEHGGFWFVAGADAATAKTPVDNYSRALFYDNWPDLVPGSPEHLAQQAEVIKQEQETYRQWAEGEVYGVILERRKRYGRAPVKSHTDATGLVLDYSKVVVTDEWEEAESIWDNYLDDTYTPQAVACEHFELTEDEVEALGLPESTC